MTHLHRDAVRAALAAALVLLPQTGLSPRGLSLTGTNPLGGQAQAQSSPGWFVPEAPKPPASAAAPRSQTAQPAPPPRPRPPARPPEAPPAAPGTLGGDGLGGDQQGPLPPLQVQLPPMPEIPPIPKGSPTPAAIVGILSPQDVLRVSTAFQAASRELGVRRNKLNEDAQKEQTVLRDLAQSFANERAKLTPEQIRAREKEYESHVYESRRKLSERDRIIQEAGQYVMAQINQVVEQVAQQVAASRGVNMVLNRGQILGTTADFDLTPQVADIVNKVLPAVAIPPDGVSPAKLATTAAGPRAAAPDAGAGGIPNGAPNATPGKKTTP